MELQVICRDAAEVEIDTSRIDVGRWNCSESELDDEVLINDVPADKVHAQILWSSLVVTVH